MKNEIRQYVAGFIKAHRRQKKWHRLVTCMAAVVVFCTTYALILPAITMEKKPQCGITEHTHNEACYTQVSSVSETIPICTLESLNLHKHTEACLNEKGEYICGYSDFVVHEHDASCFDEDGNLWCPLPEIKAHTHDESCYVQAEAAPAHTHMDECYTTERGELVCQLDESDEHQHTDDCYVWNKVLNCDLSTEPETGSTELRLICNEPEIILHEHTADCFDKDGNLICGKTQVLEHVHTEECFQTVEVPTETEILICQQEEHVHEESCFEAQEESDLSEGGESTVDSGAVSAPARETIVAGAHLVPAKSTDINEGEAQAMLAALSAPASETDPYNPADDPPTDLKQFVGNISIQRRAPGETLWAELVDNNVNADDELSFRLDYEITTGILNTDHRRVSYTVGLPVTATEAAYGDVIDDNDATKTIGTFEIDTSGHITITFDKECAEGNAENAIQGHISFHSTANALQRDDDNENNVTFEDGLVIHIKETDGDLDVEKVSENVDTVGGTLDYKITVSSEHGTSTPVILTDVMTNANLNSGLTVKRTRGGETTELTPAADPDGSLGEEDYRYLGEGVCELPKMQAGDLYTITYSAKMTSSPPVTTVYEVTNTVKAESTNSAGTPVTDSSATADYFTRKLVSKSGELDEGTGEITWTILVNSNYFKNSDGEYVRVNPVGWTLRDYFVGSDGTKKEYTGGVTITPNPEPNAETDFLTVEHLPYTFPEGCPNVEYTVSYTTPNSTDIQNQAVLTPPGGSGTASETTPVKPGSYSISKDALGFSSLGMVNGELLLQEDWEITVDATGGVISPAYTLPLLGVSSKTWSQNENHYCWFLTDVVDIAYDHYFTAQQLKDLAASVKEAIGKTSYSGNYYIFASTGTSMTLSAADNVVLIGRNGDSGNYWPNYERAPDEGVKYKRFFVLFDGELGPGAGQSLTFRYSTTTSVGDGSANATRYNQVIMLIDTNTRPNATATQTYTPIVMKYDARDSKSVGKVTEYAYNDASLDYTKTAGETYGNVLRWTIQVNFPDQEYKGDVVITDTLPAGLELLQYTQSNKNYGLYANFGINGSTSNVFTGGSAYLDEDGLKDHFYSSYKGNLKCIEDGVCENTWPGDEETYTVTYKRLGNNQYQIIVPENLANAIRGGSGRIYVNARIPGADWEGITHEFENNVTVEMNGATETASHTQLVKRPVVEKSSDYTIGRLIPYTILINKEGLDLLPWGDNLTLTDVLSYQTKQGLVNAVLDYSSIMVIDSDTNKPVTFTYKVAESTLADGTTTSTLIMTIPDGTPLQVSYRYRMRGDGVITDVKNTATVSGYSTDSDSSEYKFAEDMFIQDAEASGGLESGITVHKYNQKDYTIQMEGIQFELDKWDPDGWKKLDNPYSPDGLGLYTTNGENKFLITQELTANTAYRLVEKTELKDYEPPDEEGYQFYIADTSPTAPSPCMPVDFEKTAKQLNKDDEITIENVPFVPMSYELPMTGGTGTTLYTMGGLLLLAGAGVFLLYSKKKRSLQIKSQG